MPRDRDFADLLEPLESSASYKLCVLGAIATGAAVGRFAGLHGLLAGAAFGAVVGLNRCPTIAPAIRQKLFTPHARLAPDEFRALVRQFKQSNPRLTTPQALDLIAAERMSVLNGGRATRA